MRIETEPPKLPIKDYFYFELKDGKAHVTENPTSDHAWLWKHDYTKCHKRNIPKDEHQKIWMTHIQKHKLLTSNGYSIPNYDCLSEHLTGLYKSSDLLLLGTDCR